MSDDYKYLDDPEIIDFNQKIEAREALDMEEEEIPTSPLMFGPTGRGSPEMELRENRKLYSDSAKALRNEGMNDDSHLKNTKAWNPKSEEQQKEEEDERQFDEAMSNMYKGMKKSVKSTSGPSSNKGGARKRSSRRGSRRSRKGKRGSRKSKRNKSSRRRRR